MGLTFVWSSKRAIDFAIGGEITAMSQTLWIVLLATVAGLAASLSGRWLNERTLALMLIDIQNRIFTPPARSVWDDLESPQTGDLMYRLNTDAQEVVQTLGQTIIQAVVMMLRMVGASVLLWTMDSKLVLILLALCPLLMVSRIYFRRLRRLHGQLKNSEGRLGNTIEENFRYRTLIVAVNMQKARRELLSKGQQEVFDLKTKVLNFSTFSRGTVSILANIGFLITFCWGVVKLSTGEISFGTLSAFLQLVIRIQGPTLSLMGFIPTLVKYRAAQSRVLEILSKSGLETPGDQFKCVDRIHLCGVHFRYDQMPILSGLNISFSKGFPTAIIGSSGKGKSTLLRLLLKLIDPSEGKILIERNGELTELKAEHRVNIGYVPQGDKLFSGTIRENLNVSVSEHSDQIIKEALIASCAEFVYDLPEGIETHVGEAGLRLSEGQVQRIAVARAILGNYPIWLFDEVTSALDPYTAMKLIENLLRIGRDKIILFITHDKDVAKLCAETIDFK